MARFLKEGRERMRSRPTTRRCARRSRASLRTSPREATRRYAQPPSVKFDRWDREDFRLTDREIKDALSELTQRKPNNCLLASAT